MLEHLCAPRAAALAGVAVFDQPAQPVGAAHALQDAASVASLLITTEAMVAERPAKAAAAPAGGGDMGGMGGMDF